MGNGLCTSPNGFKGGPVAISTAFVPGRILLSDPCSTFAPPPVSDVVVLLVPPIPGDLGPICTSVNGGGLGRRGKLEGDAGAAILGD